MNDTKDTRPRPLAGSLPPLGRLLALAALLATAALAPLAVEPPPAADSEPLRQALADVRQIAAAPHPIGSEAHAQVRRLLIRRVAEAGLSPVVQETTAVHRHDGDEIEAARVRNVIARLPGRSPTGALLLIAHYDSVPTSPGAADDGAGIAALLAALRSLAAGPPPRNDVLFLFSDAEEVGLLGARAFAASELAREVRFVVNFEARGTAGPAILFEVRPPRAPLLRRFARVAPRPVAASFTEDVYRRLPNDTDFSAFRDAGTAGLNFAFIERLSDYHSPRDRVENLDASSLHHHLATATALAHDLAEADLAALAAPGGTANYFNVTGLGLVAYSAGWNFVLLVVAVLSLGAALGVGLSRRRLSLRRLLLALTVPPLAAIASVAIVLLADRLLFGVLVDGVEQIGSATPLLAGWGVLGFAVAAALLVAAARRLGAAHVAGAAAAWWLVLAALAILLLPGSAYLLLWPLLGTIAAIVLALRADRSRRGGALAAVLVLAATPALLLWVPALDLLVDALGAGAWPIVAFAAALLAAALLPQLDLVAGRRPVWLPAAAAVAALAVVGWVVATSGHGPERPRPNTLVYALDGDRGEATWASSDPRPDRWTSQVLRGEDVRRAELDGFLSRPRPMLIAPAEPLAVAGPVLEPAGGGAGEEGWLRLRVRSPRRAPAVDLTFRSARPIPAIEVAGRRFDDIPPIAHVSFHGLPADGFELAVLPEAAVEVIVVDRSYGLPDPAGAPLNARPADLVPHRSRPTDQTLVKREYVLPARGAGDAEPARPTPAGRQAAAEAQPSRGGSDRP